MTRERTRAKRNKAATRPDVGMVALVGGQHHSVDDRANVPFCRWHHMRLQHDDPCPECPIRKRP